MHPEKKLLDSVLESNEHTCEKNIESQNVSAKCDIVQPASTYIALKYNSVQYALQVMPELQFAGQLQFLRSFSFHQKSSNLHPKKQFWNGSGTQRKHIQEHEFQNKNWCLVRPALSQYLHADSIQFQSIILIKNAPFQFDGLLPASPDGRPGRTKQRLAILNTS